MPAWSMLGATAWLAGDSAQYRVALEAARRLNPRPAEFYAEQLGRPEAQRPLRLRAAQALVPFQVLPRYALAITRRRRRDQTSASRA